MTTRIPSSLKWLIDKRGRLDAEVQKTRASLKSAKKLIKELSEIEKDLKAIDMACCGASKIDPVMAVMRIQN